MALLKDLIVQGASRFVGDAYFNNIKSGTFYGNLAGGAKGSIPYQSATDTTTLLGIGSEGLVLKVGSGGVPVWGSDSNSDTKVTQTVTGSGNTDYRPLIVGASSSGSSSPTFSTVTDTTYATHQLYVKPSTGDFYTKGTINAAGGFLTGTLTIETNGTSNYNQGIRINRKNTNEWATLLIGKSGDATSGTGTSTAGDGAWLIATPASSNSLIFNLNNASESVGLCLKGHGNNDIKWNDNTVWHAGNDGSGSGLNADFLDGMHAEQIMHYTGFYFIPGNSTHGSVKHYSKIGSITFDGAWQECGASLTFYDIESMRLRGELKFTMRTSSTKSTASAYITWMNLTNTEYVNSFRIYRTDDGVYDIYFELPALNYQILRFYVMSQYKNSNVTLTWQPGSALSDTEPTYVNERFISTLNSYVGNATNATNATNDANGSKIDTTYLKLSGGTMTGALTTPSLTVTGASSFSQAINGSILGNAATASRWQNARTLTLTGAVTGSVSIDGSANVSLTTTVNHNHDDRYLKLAGGWMDTDALIYYKGLNSSESAYSSIGYRSTTPNGIKMHLGGDTYNTKALYIVTRGYDSSNDNGGLAVDNDGVTAFGAGDTGSVFRVVNEDNADQGAQFAVLKENGAYVRNNLTVGTQSVDTNSKLAVIGNVRITNSTSNTGCKMEYNATDECLEFNF